MGFRKCNVAVVIMVPLNIASIVCLRQNLPLHVMALLIYPLCLAEPRKLTPNDLNQADSYILLLLLYIIILISSSIRGPSIAITLLYC